MDMSLFLAKVMGLYFLIISVAFLINMKRFKAMMTEMVDSPALLFTVGLMVLIMGILLIVSHTLWVANWQVLVTLVAWLVFLKGIMNVVFPKVAHSMAISFIRSPSASYLPILINLILGLIFCYYGFLATGL